jgi:hypothetical protein
VKYLPGRYTSTDCLVVLRNAMGAFARRLMGTLHICEGGGAVLNCGANGAMVLVVIGNNGNDQASLANDSKSGDGSD